MRNPLCYQCISVFEGNMHNVRLVSKLMLSSRLQSMPMLKVLKKCPRIVIPNRNPIPSSIYIYIYITIRLVQKQSVALFQDNYCTPVKLSAILNMFSSPLKKKNQALVEYRTQIYRRRALQYVCHQFQLLH